MRKLIDINGHIDYGYTPTDEINYLDFDLRNAMDKPLKRWQKKLKFNQFQFVGMTSKRFIMGMAVVDLKYVSNCFIYLYDIEQDTFEEFDFIQAFAINTHSSTQPNLGMTQFRKGKNCLSIEAKAQKRHIKLHIDNGPSLNATILENAGQRPLSLCAKAGYNGWVYTQKNTALIVAGTLKWQGKVFELESNTLAAVDWSAGYMRRETNWYWACLSGYLADGRRIGFNFASGVNETGFSENALWLDGKQYKIDLMNFEFNRYQESQAWQLVSSDGTIKLNFNQQGKRAQKLNLLFIASNFRQFFGHFNGSIQVKDEIIELKDAWGLVEDHYAKW